MSSTQVEERLAAAGTSEAMSNEILDIYSVSRTVAFKASIGLLTYFALMALIVSMWLPKRKLVESEPESPPATA